MNSDQFHAIRQMRFLADRGWKRKQTMGRRYYWRPASDEIAVNLNQAEAIERARPKPIPAVKANHDLLRIL